MKQHLVITYLGIFFALFATAHGQATRQIMVDVTIVNQQNQQIYHSQKSYNDTELPVNDGFTDLYSTLKQNTLYPESSSVLHSVWTNLSQDNLLIFDGPLAGIAVHMAPPQVIGNTIIYRGHVVGPKQSDGDGGHLYPRPQCCENVDKGMLMTFTPQQLQQPRTMLPVNQTLVSAAIYRAGREEWKYKKEVLTESYFPWAVDPIHQYKQQLVASFSTPSGIITSTYIDRKSLGILWEHPASGLYAKAGVSHPWQESRLNFLPPDPLTEAPMRYFYERYKDQTPESLLRNFTYFKYLGYRAYLATVPGYEEAIERYQSTITMAGWQGKKARLKNFLTYHLLGNCDTPFHVSDHIKTMYKEMVACRQEKERIAQQEAQKKSWEREKHRADMQEQTRMYEQCNHIINQVLTEYPDDTFADELSMHEEYAHVLSQLMFFEQAHLDPNRFYGFEGKNDEQNVLHDRMREYLLCNSSTMVSKHHFITNGSELARTFGQQAFVAAFLLNEEMDTGAGEGMFLVATHILPGIANGMALRSVDIAMHPVDFVVSQVTGLAMLIKGTYNIALGQFVMNTDEQTAYRDSWKEVFGSIKSLIVTMNPDDWERAYHALGDIDWSKAIGAYIIDGIVCSYAGKATALCKNTASYQRIARVASNTSKPMIDKIIAHRTYTINATKIMKDDLLQFATDVARYSAYRAETAITKAQKCLEKLRHVIQKQYRRWYERYTYITPDGLPIDADDVEREMSTIARFMDAVGDSIKKGTPSKIERTRKSCMATVFNAEYIAQCSKEAIKYGDKVVDIALDHIFGIELEEVKKMMGAIKRRILGYHSNYLGGLVAEGKVIILGGTRKMHPSGVYMADIMYEGIKERGKTFFPDHWCPKKVVEKIQEVLLAPSTTSIIDKQGNHVVTGATTENVWIRIIFSKDMKKIITAYPDAKLMFDL